MSKVRNLFFAAAVSLVLAFPSRAKADDLAFMVTSSGQFGVIDLNTGAFSLRSNLSIIAIGLGETPDGKLYTSDSNGVVYQVNPTNGSLTTVGSNGVANFGIGSTTSGLYAVDNLLNLYSINPGTGAAAKIGATGLPQPQGLTTMGLSAGAATLYITYGPSFGPATLYSVNTATGAATAIGNTGVDGIAAVVFENGNIIRGIELARKHASRYRECLKRR